MYLYKTNVALLCVLQPASLQVVLERSSSCACRHMKEATYGVVQQYRGKIVGVLPVLVSDNTSTVLGVYTSHGSDMRAHNTTAREMLELFMSELSGQTARVRVPLHAASHEDSIVNCFLQCGFAEEERTASEAMTSGTRVSSVPREPVMPYMAHDFSNSAIIDYRPGLNFSSMLANKQSDFMTTGSEYKVNLDNNGHTVNMQIQPAKIAASLASVASPNAPVFLSNEQIANVASRIASELCGKPVLEAEAAPLAPFVSEAVPPHIARQLEVMKHRIDALQKELKFDAVAGEQSRADPQPIVNQAPVLQPAPLQASFKSLETENNMQMDAGLRHHADILRETQRKIEALETDMSYVLGVSTDHAECLNLMDEGLRNQKSEIESSHAMTRLHNEQLSETQERMLSYETDVAEHRADSLQLQEECLSSMGALRDEYNTQTRASSAINKQLYAVDAGLQNHRNEIRALRSEYTANADIRSAHEEALAASKQLIASTQRQLIEMDSGLTNHQTQIRSLKQDMQSHNANMNSTLEEQRGQLRNVQSGMQTNNSTLSAGLHNHKEEIRSLRSEAAQQRQGAEAMRAQQSQSAQSLQSMQSAQSMQAHAAIPAQAQLQNLQSQIDALQNTILMSQAPSQGRVATNVSRGDLSSFLQTRAQR